MSMKEKYIYILSELKIDKNNLPTGWVPFKYCASGLAVWNYLTHNGHSHTLLSVNPTGEKDKNSIIEIIESSNTTELKRHNEAYENPLIGFTSEEYDEIFIVHKHEIFEGWEKEHTQNNGGYSFIDLGLPSGLLWATCNVGATSPEQTGLYFAWGETTGYTAEQIKNGERSFSELSYKSIHAASISTDLTLEHDAAHIHMGGKWRMPTNVECQELIDNCNLMWTDDYNGTGVAGCIFTSKVNGNSVFFPAAGCCNCSAVISVGSFGYFWSASWGSSSFAWYLYFFSGIQEVYSINRYFGYSVRGVCKRE